MAIKSLGVQFPLHYTLSPIHWDQREPELTISGKELFQQKKSGLAHCVVLRLILLLNFACCFSKLAMKFSYF